MQLVRRANARFSRWPMSPRTWNEPSHMVLQLSLMLVSGTLTGRADELADMLVDPHHSSIPHLAAPAAAMGFVERGDDERARRTDATGGSAHRSSRGRGCRRSPIGGGSRPSSGSRTLRCSTSCSSRTPASLLLSGRAPTAEVPSTASWLVWRSASDGPIRPAPGRVRASPSSAAVGARVWIPRSVALLERAG